MCQFVIQSWIKQNEGLYNTCSANARLKGYLKLSPLAIHPSLHAFPWFVASHFNNMLISAAHPSFSQCISNLYMYFSSIHFQFSYRSNMCGFVFILQSLDILIGLNPIFFKSESSSCRCNYKASVDQRLSDSPVPLPPSSHLYMCSTTARQPLRQRLVRRVQKRARVGMRGFRLRMR